MEKKKILRVFTILILATAVLGGYIYLNSQKKPADPGTQTINATVRITDSGFNPNEVKIKKGETVKFVNEGTQDHWPAADKHPGHNDYPEKGGCVGSKFDACRALGPGEEFLFTFNYEGAWNFHDHLNPSFAGTVIVEPDDRQDQYSIDIVSAPDAVNLGDKSVRIIWGIKGRNKSISHTAVYYDYESHAGNLDGNTTPDLAGYPNYTKEYEGKEIDLPNTLGADLTLDQVGTIYYRTYAIIDGKHYWTPEQTIDIVK